MFSEQQPIFCQPVPSSTSGKRVALMNIAFSQLWKIPFSVLSQSMMLWPQFNCFLHHRYYRVSPKNALSELPTFPTTSWSDVGNWQSSAYWWQVRKCIFWDTLYNWVTSIYFCFNTKLNWRVCTMGFRAGQCNRICLLNSDRLEPTHKPSLLSEQRNWPWDLCLLCFHKQNFVKTVQF